MLPTPLSGADRSAYDALHDGVIALARPDLRHLEFTGPKAADVITGLVTNHVLALAEGEGQYAAALTAKGKIVADLRIVRLGTERYLTTAAEACWPGWRDLVRKYVNPRLARYTEPELHAVALLGPLAHATADRTLAAINARTEATTLPAAPYSAVRYTADEHELFRITSPELGDVPGVHLLLPPALGELLLAELTRDTTVTPGTSAALDVARIEAGRPLWGRDMDDNTIPQEANLGTLGALSFDKGCYTGQETVARIHFRGHVNRHLRVLHSSTPLPTGAEVRLADGKVVGDVRSSALSPRVGPISIAMVRREVEPGTGVQVMTEATDPIEAVVAQ